MQIEFDVVSERWRSATIFEGSKSHYALFPNSFWEVPPVREASSATSVRLGILEMFVLHNSLKCQGRLIARLHCNAVQSQPFIPYHVLNFCDIKYRMADALARRRI